MSIATAQLKHAFGLRIGVNGAIAFQNELTVVYPCGSNLVIYNIDNRSQAFISCLENSKKMSAMAISCNRRYVALAQTTLENRPVVIIYDLKTIRKVKILTGPETEASEFTSIAFSPDSKYLIGQTGGPEWLLIYWAWEKSKELATLKLSSSSSKFTVNEVSICPNDGTLICAVGNTFFKMFRYSENKLKSLSIMKVMLENFRCHCWVSDDSLILGTDTGKWILVINGEIKKVCDMTDLNFSVDSMKLSLGGTGSNNNPITSITSNSDGFAIARILGKVVRYIKTDEPDYYRHVQEIQIPINIKSIDPANSRSQIITDMCFSPSGKSIVCCTNVNQIFYHTFSPHDDGTIDPIAHFELLSFSFHHSEILGLDICYRKPIVATCAMDRSVRIWNFETNNLDLSKDFAEEAHSIALHPSGLYILVGFSDKLRLMNIFLDDIQTYKEFDIASCREVAFSHGGNYFAAVKKSMIHIYSSIRYELIFSLKGHIDTIKNVAWTVDDKKLISCGMDGAVYEWNMCTGTRVGESVLKTCGYTGITVTSDGNTIFATGTDKSLRQISESNVVNEVNNLDVQLTSLTLSKSGEMLFCGTIMGTVRSFKFPLTDPTKWRDFIGHSSQIIKMKISPNDDFLVTISHDSSVMIWQLNENKEHSTKKSGDHKWAEEVLVNKMDIDQKNYTILELQTYTEDLKSELSYQLSLKDLYYGDKMKEMTKKFVEEIELLKITNDKLKSEKERDASIQKETLSELMTFHTKEIHDNEKASNQKILQEYQRYEDLKATLLKLQEERTVMVQTVEDSKDVAIEELTVYYEAKIAENSTIVENLIKDTRDNTMEYEGMKRLIEEDADREILDTKIMYGLKLQEEKQINERLKGENGIMMKKFASLQKEIDDQKNLIKGIQAETQKLEQVIRNLEADKTGLTREIRERDETIRDKEKRIYDFKNKNQELMKFKFVLDYKVHELTKDLEPMACQIQKSKDQAEEMEVELAQLNKHNQLLITSIRELKHKLKWMDGELQKERQLTRSVEAVLGRFKSDLYNCVGHIQEPKLLKESIIKVYNKYVKKDSNVHDIKNGPGKGDDDAMSDMARHREHLENTVATMRNKLVKDTMVHRTVHLQIMHENVTLIKEINDLRMELKNERNHIKTLESALGLNGKNGAKVKRVVEDIENNRAKPFSEKELQEAGYLMESQRELIAMLRKRILELESYQYNNNNNNNNSKKMGGNGGSGRCRSGSVGTKERMLPPLHTSR